METILLICGIVALIAIIIMFIVIFINAKIAKQQKLDHKIASKLIVEAMEENGDFSASK